MILLVLPSMELDDEVCQNQSVMHSAWSESEYSADYTLDNRLDLKVNMLTTGWTMKVNMLTYADRYKTKLRQCYSAGGDLYGVSLTYADVF